MQTETLQSPTVPAEQTLSPKTSTTLEPPKSPPLNEGANLIHQITDFLARYLHCSEHQRNVLALWIFHTHCFPSARATPYLHIRSQLKQSGKTLCLHLLSLLCERPAPTTGFTAATLTHRTDTESPPTFLLDECQATLGSRSRSKNPVLRAILSNGFERGFGYSGRTHERNIFSPKAFAGIGQFPEVLADRSLPILLEPLRALEPQPPGPPTRAGVARGGVERFHPKRAAAEAEPLLQNLRRWAEENTRRLDEAPPYTCDDFPPGLTPRRQDIIEPLLHIADAVGGDWPAIARETLMALFDQEVEQENQAGIELLAQLRQAFAHNGDPKRIPTSALLDWLRAEPGRPWNQDGLLTAHGLASRLLPFAIRPRLQRTGSSAPARGYAFHDFVPLWTRFVPGCEELTANSQEPKAQIGAACNGVTELDPYDPNDPVLEHMEKHGYRPFCPDDPGTHDGSYGGLSMIRFGCNQAGDRRYRARREARFNLPPLTSAHHPGGSQKGLEPKAQSQAPKAAIGAACNDVALAAQERAEYDAGIAKLRAMQQSLPACAEGYTRIAPTRKR